MLIGGIVDRVVGNGGSEGAGNDALQRAGAGNTTELDVLEQEAGGVIKGGDAGARKSVRKDQASEREFFYGVTDKNGEAGAVLVVILYELRLISHSLALQDPS